MIQFSVQFGEHPEERATNVESTEKLECVTTVNEIYAAIKVLLLFLKKNLTSEIQTLYYLVYDGFVSFLESFKAFF